jgi:hypothetical protein
MTRPVFFVLSLLAMACGGNDKRSALSPWDDALKSELLSRLATDQAARERLVEAMRAGAAPDTALFMEMRAIDSSNALWLRDAVARHGWPERDAVGNDGARAAFLLVQHADHDTAFQAAMLPALDAAFRRGQAEGGSVALLTDRLAVARGEPQIYGSQTTSRDGRLVFEPIADSAGVDARRAQMGLPPLSDYMRVLDSVYGRKRPP